MKCEGFVVCDACGTKYKNDMSSQDIFQIQEFLHIDFVGGYGSVFGDGTHVECDICQTCLKGMIKDVARITEHDWQSGLE